MDLKSEMFSKMSEPEIWIPSHLCYGVHNVRYTGQVQHNNNNMYSTCMYNK
jgi:hypothetical protein